MHAPIFIVLTLAACLPSFAAQHAHPGGEIVKKLADRLPDGDIDTYFFSGKDYGLCILDEGDGPARYGSLRQAMQKNDCAAGVNGGYFGADAAKTPIGLVKHLGKSVTPFASKGFSVSGVLYDTGREIRLERSATPTHPVARMQEAVQGGPFLVEHGSTVRGLDDKRKARRTFIATDGGGNWCIGVTPPLTLHELGVRLATPGTLKRMRVEKALNLDGGSSSAMWTATGGTLHTNLKPVRNYIGVAKRKK